MSSLWRRDGSSMASSLECTCTPSKRQSEYEVRSTVKTLGSPRTRAHFHNVNRLRLGRLNPVPISTSIPHLAVACRHKRAPCNARHSLTKTRLNLDIPENASKPLFRHN
jgi:hypothetical protein